MDFSVVHTCRGGVKINSYKLQQWGHISLTFLHQDRQQKLPTNKLAKQEAQDKPIPVLKCVNFNPNGEPFSHSHLFTSPVAPAVCRELWSMHRAIVQLQSDNAVQLQQSFDKNA